jgi:hypothetical protein
MEEEILLNGITLVQIQTEHINPIITISKITITIGIIYKKVIWEC